MNKFQRILWTVNGVLIFLTLLLVAVVVIDELSGDWFYSYSPPQVIVGEELEEAKKEGLVLQGLDYESPLTIYGSRGYILPVTLKTYDNPKQTKKSVSNFSSSSERSADFFHVADILFLDANMVVTKTLLNKKAFISSFRYPTHGYNEYGDIETQDTIARHITYHIGFEDSNKDGLLNDSDFNDLYISDLNGDNFVPITNGVDVSNYKFLNRNKLLIEYFKRDDQRQEYKQKYFALYLIKERKLEDLTSLHNSLNSLEQSLTK